MREFKFRCWDGKKMHYENELMICFSGTLVLRDKDLNCQKLCNHMYKILQCTNLKDKNNKDIYEGDIIQNRDGTWKVEYIEDFAAFYMVIGDEMQQLNTCNRSNEVIGNIFENEELLKEEK